MTVGIAILTMMVVTVAAHLGLPQAISEVVSKVCECHKCLSFWSTLIVVMYFERDIFVAVLLSITAAYISNWFAVLLIVLHKIYERLWERVNKKQIHRNR